MTQVLREAALRVEVDPFRPFPEEDFERVCDAASTVCFHINLSVRAPLAMGTRALSERFQERGLHVVNGRVQDIRKSSLHRHLEAIGLLSPGASQDGPPDEVLFLKTDLNHGGSLERWLPPETIEACGYQPLISADMGPYQYRALHRAELTDEAWQDPALAVEKFIHNYEHSFYRAYFSGKNVIIVKAHAPQTIKKIAGDPRDICYLSDLPTLRAGTDDLPISERLKRDVLTFVEASPVEYGCVDILHDGRDNHYVVDLNLTPYAGSAPGNESLNDILRAGMTHPGGRKASGPQNGPLVG